MHPRQKSAHPGRVLRRTAMVGAGALAAMTVALGAPAAHAAAPSNDAWESATEVSALPFEDTVDTTTATKDAVNPDLGRYRFHTVWYHLQLPADGRVLVSTQGTDYFHKVAIFEADGAASPLEWTKLKAKRGSGFAVSVEADTDYFVVVGAYKGEPGGTAAIEIREPAEFDVTLADTGQFDPVDGSAVVHGQASSDRPIEVYVSLTLRQLVGERVVTGSAADVWAVPAGETTWELTVSGRWAFKPGPARVVDYSQVQVFDQGIRIAREDLAPDTVTLE